MTQSSVVITKTSPEWRALETHAYPMREILAAVKEDRWQRTRVSLLSTSLQTKYDALVRYLASCEHSELARIQVSNYVKALRRGGLIK